jgi:predicted nucleic acid-binding protein
MFLLDTNIVSELRKPRPHPGVISWFNELDESDIFLSAVTLGEIQAGIEITRDQDIIKAATIEDWADKLANSHNILSMDVKAFRLWAKLMHKQSDTVYEDAMIAAIAIIHKLTVVTRNVRDFERFNVSIFNPFVESKIF